MPNCRFSSCRCETGELIKNGGFEVRSTEPGFPFQYWQAINVRAAHVNNHPDFTNIAYEGLAAARFDSLPTPLETNKSVTLEQTVIVTPGCSYRLSFAENLLVKGNGAAGTIPHLTARLLYIDNFGNTVDLIIIPIAKFSQDHDPNRGYTFHQATTIRPVPCDVSELIVRFEYFENNNLEGSSWLLDGVSIRAVFPISDCCGTY